MHVGKSAYSGHYMAQIKKFETNEWFSFNDESIHKIKKKQQLGCTDDEIEKQKSTTKQQSQSTELTSESTNENQSQTPPSKSNESLKNFKSFSTSNAYLLVYYRKDLINSKNFINNIEKSVVKKNKIVESDNIELEKWFEDFKNTKIDEKETQNTERTIIRSIYNSLWCNNEKRNEGFYFINTDFIRKLISSQTGNISSTSEITSKYLCNHKHLNPFAINRFKLISKEGLFSILTNYAYKLNEIGAFEAENNETTRCLQCVVNIFDYLKLKDKLKDDSKLLRLLLKVGDSSANNDTEMNGNQENGHTNGEVILIDDDKSKSPTSMIHDIALNSKRWFWIGKESLKLWTSLALKKAEAQLPPVKFNDIEVIDLTNGNTSGGDQNGDINGVQEIAENSNDKQIANNIEIDTDSAQITFSFNEDIVCTHGCLSTTLNKRLVSQDCLKIYQSYFPNMRQFLSDEVECRKCKVGILRRKSFFVEVAHNTTQNRVIGK
jgi:hypothetical protein